MLLPVLLVCLLYTAAASPVLTPLNSEQQNLTRVARQTSTGLGTWMYIDGERYFIAEKHVKRNWVGAKAICGDNEGSGLISLDTPEKVGALVKHFRNYAASSLKIWTSGKSKKSGSRFEWSQGDFIPENYYLWGQGEPENTGGSESCVYAKFKSPTNRDCVTLHTAECDIRAMFVCQEL